MTFRPAGSCAHHTWMNDISLPTLDNIEAAIWRELQQCLRNRTHAWRTPVLATTDVRGDADARLLVLREVDPGARRLRFFTDARSPKRAQVQLRPQGALVMWSPVLNWQLRLAVNLQLQFEGIEVSSRWERVRNSRAASDYLSTLAPGDALGHHAARQSEDAAARVEPSAHFALLDAHVRAIDWLELSEQGHRRARFDADGARWVQP